MKIKTIIMVDAADFPSDVMDHCLDNEIQTHYQNDIAFIADDDNPFATWLRSLGYEFENKTGDWIAIMST